MRGRPPKDPSRRQGHRKPRTITLVQHGGTPAPPKKLLRVTQEWWAAYWESGIAKATREEHMPVIRRLFIRYDERERAYRAVRAQGRVTQGSQGQLVAHPLLKYIDACDAEIRHLEDRLGLSPKAFAQLGSNFAAAQRSLDDINRSLDEVDDDDTESAGADPRLGLV